MFFSLAGLDLSDLTFSDSCLSEVLMSLYVQ